MIKTKLCLIINESFRQGVFRDNLKVGMVYPIHKGDSEMVCSNYRPISILPIFSKLLEKLMHKRLSNYLKKYKILYDHQFGFQKGKSTEDAALDLYRNIIKAIEKHEKTCAIFLDFAKAFDTVNHDILRGEMEHYGIRRESLEWFKSYLENRKQCFNINRNSSKFSDLTCGVPQGSALGPLLFLFYINDTYASAPKVSFHLFADDTCLFYCNKNLETLEKNDNVALINISNWLKANKFTLNVKKSHLLIFNINEDNDNNKMQTKLFIDKEELEQNDIGKYLGIYFDKT